MRNKVICDKFIIFSTIHTHNNLISMTSEEYHSISAVQNILLSLTNDLIDWLIIDWLIDLFIDDNDDHDDEMIIDWWSWLTIHCKCDFSLSGNNQNSAMKMCITWMIVKYDIFQRYIDDWLLFYYVTETHNFFDVV